MIGKMLPYFAIASLQAALALTVARLRFHVPIPGDLIFLHASILLFALNTLGLGLFMSSLAHTQQQAILTNIFVILPSMLMSGFISPIRNIPTVVQWLTYLIPLRYFLEIVRGICLKGLTPLEVWPQLLPLVFLTVVSVVGGSLGSTSWARSRPLRRHRGWGEPGLAPRPLITLRFSKEKQFERSAGNRRGASTMWGQTKTPAWCPEATPTGIKPPARQRAEDASRGAEAQVGEND